MREWEGDIWDRFGKSFIVVPTNIGWKLDKEGRIGANVMGRGVAAEASSRVPGLAKTYGEFCARFGKNTPVTFDLSTALVLFPTKALIDNPAMSWKNNSTLECVEKSAYELASMSWMKRELVRREAEGDIPELEDDDVYLPYVGCGNGGLPEDTVLPMLRDILVADRFVLVRFRPF